MALKINSENFHKYICQLNYYSDFSDKQNDMCHLNLELEDNQQVEPQFKTDITKVPNKFESLEQYTDIWEKLFKIEAKAQIIKEQIDQQEPAEQFNLIGSQKQQSFDLFMFTNINEITVKYNFGDIVLISKQKPEIQQLENLLGIVEQFDDHLKIKTVFDQTNMESRHQALKQIFIKNSTWHIKKICSLQTLNREYQALYSLNYLNLKNFIIDPQENLNSKDKFEIPQKLENKLNEVYNTSQVQAINESLKIEGITLVQGPPGTGKTTTVLGTLSVLLNSLKQKSNLKDQMLEKRIQVDQISKQEKLNIYQKKRPWLYQQNYEDFRDKFPEQNNFNYENSKITDRQVHLELKKNKNYAPPEKILICAPSNAAIDEIVRKILEKGLFDSEGERQDPFIVRIGPNFDENLQQVSFDFLVNQQSKSCKNENQINQVKMQILQKARIICGTLSSSGSLLLTQSQLQFDTVVIDEAAQAVEISTLIPLKYGCRRLILIGDSNQLPATIFSKTCEKYNYNISLFERLQKTLPTYMLKTQYRMHPLISQFISSMFYQDQIRDSENINELIGNQKLYTHLCFQPFIFIHTPGPEKFAKNSFKNQEQCDVVLDIYNALKTSFPNFDIKNLGIISPYSKQVQLIRKKISKSDQTIKCQVEVNTVDGFQGREKDIIIFSTVRANINFQEPTLGFLRDVRRMNVGLSRARISLIVVGDMRTLNMNKQWRGLIDFAVQNQAAYNSELIRGNVISGIQKQSHKMLIRQKK